MQKLELKYKTVNRTRRAGVLLHPTSLPGPHAYGDIGHEAYRFIEFLNENGFKVWQMLPLGPTHDDKSPYQCLSSHAGNPLLISLDWLTDKGLLNQDEENENLGGEVYRKNCLIQACANFYKSNNKELKASLLEFCTKHQYWLDDYALFMAFKQKYNNLPWYEWPDEIRHRDPYEIEEARNDLQQEILQVEFEQFIFFTQWQEIRDYAAKHEVEIFGDIPIFIARDSADAWAQRNNFLMDLDGYMTFVAGVPPDAFSDSGQRWGNPLYDWEYMESTNFLWWKERFKTQLELFDIVRFDHFRGLHSCWHIPATDETAINGKWQDVPGIELLAELFDEFDYLPLVAEDLGVITDEVIELKMMYSLAGMKVLQFAFDGNNDNPHLPHCHNMEDVIYTGTHDNNTTYGWACDTANFNNDYLSDYCDCKLETPEQRSWELIRMAMASVSFLCVVPMQDILMLDSSARMNTPGTVGGNWEWRFNWEQLNPGYVSKFNKFIDVYQR